jgi:hypothetical protein
MVLLFFEAVEFALVAGDLLSELVGIVDARVRVFAPEVEDSDEDVLSEVVEGSLGV